MSDILLEFVQIDRAGRGIYKVMRRELCDLCPAEHWGFTGQTVRFDLDGNHHIKRGNMRFDIN